MAELINKQDSLNQGREKINASILASERAERNANEALSQSENTQIQLDTIVINGDSSVEAAQARVDENGHVYSTLKDRLDTENADTLNKIGDLSDLHTSNKSSLVGAVNDSLVQLSQVEEEIEYELTQKVNKGESGSITWAMAAQDFREQITGGNTAVVGPNSVLADNIVDGAVTFNKLESSRQLYLNPLETGKFIRTDGTIGSSTPYSYTDNIQLKAGETIRFTGSVGESVSAISEWSFDGKFIRNLASGVNTGNSETHDYEYTATQDTYVRISWYNEYKCIIFIDPENIRKQVSELGSYFYKDISDEIEILETGKFIRPDGTIGNSNPYAYTDNIHLKIGEKITVEATAQKDIVSVISEWTVNGEFVRSLVIGEQEDAITVGTYEYTADNSMYIRISYNNSNYIKVVKHSAINQIDYNNDFDSFFEENDLKEAYKHLVLNTLCIGDSLTNGAYYGQKADGTPSNGAGIAENYPYYLSKMTGWNTVNAGKNGATVLSWYNEFINSYDYTDYDTYVIFLGTNYGLTDTLVEDTTISDGQTYLDYADTNTGTYCKIIETIFHQNPNAHIFLVTIYGGGLQTGNGWNQDIPNKVIYQIGEKYNLPVIDSRHLKNNLTDNGAELHPFGNALHFGKVGNIHLAKTVERAIIDYIYKNSLKFDKALI